MEAVKVFVLTVIVFGVLIFVHELGHFLACRIFGVKVNEFAIGMGPKLISFKGKKSSTVYSIRVLPIGGFNNIEEEIPGQKSGKESGEEDIHGEAFPFGNPESDTTAVTAEIKKGQYAFSSRPVWQRMIIIVAGAAMNLLLGFLLMTIVVLRTDNYASTTIYSFYDVESGAEISEFSGLKSGDEILKVGKRRVHTGDELVYAVFADGAQNLDITVLRDGQKIVIEDVTFPTGNEAGIIYGIRNFIVYAEEKNFVNTVKQAYFGSISSMTQVFDSLKGLITGKYGIQHISGPIGIGEVIGQAAKLGIDSLLMISVLLSMNLGIFNLLPIPGLDGGKFVFLAIEGIRRKPLPRQIEENATMVGMMLLFALIIVVAFKDIFTLAR